MPESHFFNPTGVMSEVTITNVTVLDNPAPFLSPLMLHIFFETSIPLPHDLKWKLTYVAPSEDKFDQELETVFLRVPDAGNYNFVLESDPPDPSKMPEEDIIGPTVILLTCSYLGQQFVQIGYYVNNEYEDEKLKKESPRKVLIDKVQRTILSDTPRISKSEIDFYLDQDTGAGEQPGNDGL